MGNSCTRIEQDDNPIEDMLRAQRDQVERMILVYGPSGSGKTAFCVMAHHRFYNKLSNASYYKTVACRALCRVMLEWIFFVEQKKDPKLFFYGLNLEILDGMRSRNEDASKACLDLFRQLVVAYIATREEWFLYLFSQDDLPSVMKYWQFPINLAWLPKEKILMLLSSEDDNNVEDVDLFFLGSSHRAGMWDDYLDNGENAKIRVVDMGPYHLRSRLPRAHCFTRTDVVIFFLDLSTVHFYAYNDTTRAVHETRNMLCDICYNTYLKEGGKKKILLLGTHYDTLQRLWTYDRFRQSIELAFGNKKGGDNDFFFKSCSQYAEWLLENMTVTLKKRRQDYGGDDGDAHCDLYVMSPISLFSCPQFWLDDVLRWTSSKPLKYWTLHHDHNNNNIYWLRFRASRANIGTTLMAIRKYRNVKNFFPKELIQMIVSYLQHDLLADGPCN